MRSYDVAECGCPLKLFERPTPEPTGTEVLLRVLAAGVCHSDLHFWEGEYDLGQGRKLKLTDRGMKLPLTMGHENVGEVVALGPQATGVRVGDRRLVYPWIGCGQCRVCRRGEENLCLKPCFVGVHRPGGYSDHLLVPHPRYLLDIGDLAPELAAPLACSGVTTYGALKKLGSLPQEQPIVVIGAGGLGLMCLSLLQAMGGKGAVAVDIDARKREAAVKAGALAAIDGRAPDAVRQIQAHFKDGVWGVIDLVGSSDTVKLGIDCLTKGGKLVVCGLFGGDVTIPTPFIPMRALNIQGSYVGTPGEMTELLALVRRARPPAIPITKRPLEEAFAALQDLKSGRLIGRSVLMPAG
jgi:D-arabinose 1-dehydrogenase-like Zn-dependent alcohol dehydrogenase